MGWLVTLGILTLLAVLPLGARVDYDSDGAVVRLVIGPWKVKVFPKPAKEKKQKPKQKKKTKPKAEKKQQKTQKKPEPKKKKSGGSVTDFLPLIKTVVDFLGDFRRKLRVNKLELKLIMAADDPCDLAMNYGRAWAAVGNLIPQLERWFVIRQRDVEVECDFTASETVIIARLQLTITLGRILAAVFVFIFHAVVELIKILIKRNNSKGGAVK